MLDSVDLSLRSNIGGSILMTCYRCRKEAEIEHLVVTYLNGEEIGDEEICGPCYKLYQRFSRGDAVKGIKE